MCSFVKCEQGALSARFKLALRWRRWANKDCSDIVTGLVGGCRHASESDQGVTVSVQREGRRLRSCTILQPIFGEVLLSSGQQAPMDLLEVELVTETFSSASSPGGEVSCASCACCVS